jgi:hypothetical protein
MHDVAASLVDDPGEADRHDSVARGRCSITTAACSATDDDDDDDGAARADVHGQVLSRWALGVFRGLQVGLALPCASCAVAGMLRVSVFELRVRLACRDREMMLALPSKTLWRSWCARRTGAGESAPQRHENTCLPHNRMGASVTGLSFTVCSPTLAFDARLC